MYTIAETITAMNRMVKTGAMPRFVMVVKVDKDEVGSLTRKVVEEKIAEKEAKLFDVKKDAKNSKKFEKFTSGKFRKVTKKFTSKKKTLVIMEHQIVPYNAMFTIPSEEECQANGYTKEKLENSTVLVLTMTGLKVKKH